MTHNIVLGIQACLRQSFFIAEAGGNTKTRGLLSYCLFVMLRGKMAYVFSTLSGGIGNPAAVLYALNSQGGWYGAVAQLGERLTGSHEVWGSIPHSSIMMMHYMHDKSMTCDD